jgi:hypothetical protein
LLDRNGARVSAIARYPSCGRARRRASSCADWARRFSSPAAPRETHGDAIYAVIEIARLLGFVLRAGLVKLPVDPAALRACVDSARSSSNGFVLR